MSIFKTLDYIKIQTWLLEVFLPHCLLIFNLDILPLHYLFMIILVFRNLPIYNPTDSFFLILIKIKWPKIDPTTYLYLHCLLKVSISFQNLTTDDCNLRPQSQFGISYKDNGFILFQAQVLELPTVAFLVDVFARQNEPRNSDPAELIGSCYIMPKHFKSTSGILFFYSPILI